LLACCSETRWDSGALSSDLDAHIRPCLPACLPACLPPARLPPACLVTYPPAHRPTYLPCFPSPLQGEVLIKGEPRRGLISDDDTSDKLKVGLVFQVSGRCRVGVGVDAGGRVGVGGRVGLQGRVSVVVQAVVWCAARLRLPLGGRARRCK